MISKIKNDKNLKIIFAASFIIFLAAAGVIFADFGNKNEPVIIHFDAYKGIDHIGNKIEMFGILFLEMTILLVNLFLSDFIYSRERFFSYVLGFVNLVISALVFIAAIAINSIN
ncbi:MAG: hypothetical protein QMD86_01970 [Patescibacteria group bacterium]|nr:hypothetical protein [Patescibacteria group bacterium]